MQWISVEERLPSHDLWYHSFLVAAADGHWTIANYTGYGWDFAHWVDGTADKSHAFYCCGFEVIKLEDIKFWMPVPLPYNIKKTDKF